MPSLSISRRNLLRIAATVLGASTVQRATAAACVTPDAPDAGLRKSLNYTEASANPAQRCSACAFFSEAKESCGNCMIFSGPANINGRCDSWSAR